jgi:nucleoside phosphorylase
MSPVIAARRRSVRAAIASVLATLVVALTPAPGAWGAAASRASAASTGAPSGATATACPPRLLVLSALPVELDPLLAAASVDQKRTVVVSGRSFYQGTLRGNNVIMALTGIGLVNAQRTAETAFQHFRCGTRSSISGVVFSGTSGGDYIGDVMVPSRWTQDGKSWVGADPAMLTTVRNAVRSGAVPLEQSTPTGDPACACQASTNVVTPVQVTHRPQVETGGDGLSMDPFEGRAFPCTPGGSDVFGCVPCRERNTGAAAQTGAFVSGAAPFVNPNFISGYGAASTPPPGTFVEQDMETAAVFRVAANHGVPSIGFRAASDGKGDPLMLPGFPVQFFVYRQLAADNAAATALAFLSAWARA